MPVGMKARPAQGAALRRAVARVRRTLPCRDEYMVERLVDACEGVAKLRDPKGLPVLFDALEATRDFGANAALIELLGAARFPAQAFIDAVQKRRQARLGDWDWNEWAAELIGRRTPDAR